MKLLVMPESGNYDKTLPFLPSKAAFDEVVALYPGEDRLQHIKDADVIIGEPTLEELTQAEKLKFVQMTWAGADRYLKGGFPEGVLLATASGAFGETIAEHAVGMALALCRRFPGYAKLRSWRDLGTEKLILGSKALIFGAGNIGSRIAQRLSGFRVECIGVCRNTSREVPQCFSRLVTMTEAEALLPQADLIFCALPWSAETTNWFDRRRLALCKDDAVLVNVGRGTLIDTDALLEALSNGKFFGVGLDVVDPEPLPQEHPLRDLERVLLTPHVSGTSFGHLEDTESRIWAIAEENLSNFCSGSPIRNRVKP